MKDKMKVSVLFQDFEETLRWTKWSSPSTITIVQLSPAFLACLAKFIVWLIGTVISAEPVIACIGTSKGRNWLGYCALNESNQFYIHNRYFFYRYYLEK